jgi:NADH-quinone oxidoreductase subunit F
MGYNLKKMIYEVAGGIKGGKKLKAVVPGGSSDPGAAARRDRYRHGLRPGRQSRLMLGSAGVVVLDETVCIVEFALRTIKFYQHESCGWCIPCREGTDWLKKTLTRFHSGGGWRRTSTTSLISPRTCWAGHFCPLGDAAAMPTFVENPAGVRRPPEWQTLPVCEGELGELVAV